MLVRTVLRGSMLSDRIIDSAAFYAQLATGGEENDLRIDVPMGANLTAEGTALFDCAVYPTDGKDPRKLQELLRDFGGALHRACRSWDPAYASEIMVSVLTLGESPPLRFTPSTASSVLAVPLPSIPIALVSLEQLGLFA